MNKTKAHLQEELRTLREENKRLLAREAAPKEELLWWDGHPAETFSRDHFDAGCSPSMFEVASTYRAWIVRQGQQYGNGEWSRDATLLYWSGIIGDGRPVALHFRNVTEARAFWVLNMKLSACQECYRVSVDPPRKVCVTCGEALARLRDLERRYAVAKSAASRTSTMWKRIEELERTYKAADFSEKDKAAVLDQIMAEVASDEEPALVATTRPSGAP